MAEHCHVRLVFDKTRDYLSFESSHQSTTISCPAYVIAAATIWQVSEGELEHTADITGFTALDGCQLCRVQVTRLEPVACGA